MKALIKQRIIYAVQISIGITLVVWILLQIDREQFVNYFLNISFYNLFIVSLLGVISLILQFRRWRYLVERYSIHFNMKDLIPSFFAGFAFRLIIPGGHAEFSKIFLLPGKKRGKILAFGVEKVFQTIIKVIALLIVLPLTFPEYTIYYIICFLIIVVGYFLFPRIPVLKDLQEKDVNYHRIFAINLLFAFGIFISMGLQYYILLNQVDVVSISATFHTVVYLWGAGMVPISISGLGIREGLAVYFFNFYNVSAAHAVATSLFLFTINTIIPALVGAFYIYKNRTQFGEIKNSLKSTRDIIASIRNVRNKG